MSKQEVHINYGEFFGSILTKNLEDLLSEKNYLDDKLDIYAAAPEVPAVK